MKSMKTFVVAAALLGATSVAHATPVGSARGMEAEVAARVAAGVPAGLAIIDVTVPAGLAQARGDVAVELRGGLRAGRTSVKVTVTRAGRAVKTGWASVRLEALRPVLVARRPLASGDALDPRAVTIEQRPVDAASACDLPASALAGAHVRASVDAGGVVACASIERAAPVARGSVIRVLVRRGHVQVSASATLETSARPGEPAQARLEGSQRLVRGRLTDAGTLLMEGE
jgi:flagella basal body P-ring formation protein FlgA